MRDGVCGLRRWGLMGQEAGSEGSGGGVLGDKRRDLRSREAESEGMRGGV